MNDIFLLQDPKLLCVAYSAVGKLSRYIKMVILFNISQT